MTIAENRPSNSNARRAFASSSWRLATPSPPLPNAPPKWTALVMDAAQRLLFPRHRVQRRAAGGGRVRQAAALPLLRYRSASAVPLRPAHRDRQGGHFRISAAPVGCRAAHEPFRAHSRRMRRGARFEHRTQHQPARSALSRRRPHPLRRAGRPPAALHPRQSRCPGSQPGAAHARPPRQVRRHVLSPGAERQGHARRAARLPAGLLARPVARWLRRARRRSARGLSLPGPPALLPAHTERPRQQPAHLRRAGCPGRTLASAGRRAVDARILSPLARHLSRRHPRPGSRRSAGQLPVLAVPRFPLARLQRRVQRAPGTRAFPRAPAARCGARARPAPVRIRGAPRRAPLLRSRAADRSAPAGPARPFQQHAAALARAQPDAVAAVRPRRRALHARDRRADRDFSRARADRVPGDPRFLSIATPWTSTPWSRCRISGACAPPTDPWCRCYRDLLAEIKEPGRPRLRAFVSRCRQGQPQRRPRRRFAPPGAGAHDAHPDALAGSRHGDVPDRPAPGPVRRHVLARRLRSADDPRRRPPDGHGGAPQSAHAADLRRYQRGQSRPP